MRNIKKQNANECKWGCQYGIPIYTMEEILFFEMNYFVL